MATLNHPKDDEKKLLSPACRDRKKDIRIQRDLMIEHFNSLKF